MSPHFEIPLRLVELLSRPLYLMDTDFSLGVVPLLLRQGIWGQQLWLSSAPHQPRQPYSLFLHRISSGNGSGSVLVDQVVAEI